MSHDGSTLLLVNGSILFKALFYDDEELFLVKMGWNIQQVSEPLCCKP